MLGPLAASVVNLLYDEKKAAISAMFAGNDSMEHLLFEAAYYEDQLAEVTLCSGKVYKD